MRDRRWPRIPLLGDDHCTSDGRLLLPRYRAVGPMPKVVVTGGCGFIGGHLVERLIHDGDDVIVLDPGDFAPDRRHLAPFLSHVRSDIRDPAAVGSIVVSDVDMVYHLAAVVGVDRYIERPLDVIDVNYTGTKNILDAAAQAGAKVVLASTSEVFGKNPTVPWKEDADRILGSTATERWSYATSKALAEHLAFAYVRQRGLSATIVRYFNVYGPGQRPAFVVSRSIHRALHGQSPIVYDGGCQTRCFTFIDDAIAATLLAGRDELADGECFNIGGERETSMADLIRLIIEMCGAASADSVDLEVSEALGPRYEDLHRRIPDPSKAAHLLGWRAGTDLRDGVARTIDWARRNQWWLAQADAGQGH